MDSFRRDPGETSERGAKRPRLPAVFEAVKAGRFDELSLTGEIVAQALTFLVWELEELKKQNKTLSDQLKSNALLIDTLRQALGIQTDLDIVRQGLRERFPEGSAQVTERNFLELQPHWRATVELLGEDPQRLRVICVDLHSGKGMAKHGDSLGDGSRALYIARVHGNHFVPLLPVS